MVEKIHKNMRWIIVIVLAVIALNWGIWSAIGVFILGAIILLVLRYQSSQPTSRNSETKSNDDVFSEDAVFTRQAEFEKYLENTGHPAAIMGHEVYIYYHLMRPWYDKLSSEKRYDESMTQQLRTDWLDYMDSLKDRSTYNFLWLEAGDHTAAEGLRDEHVKASRKVFAIEGAFAAMIGNDAVKELARIRAMDHSAFDQYGNLMS